MKAKPKRGGQSLKQKVERLLVDKKNSITELKRMEKELKPGTELAIRVNESRMCTEGFMENLKWALQKNLKAEK